MVGERARFWLFGMQVHMAWACGCQARLASDGSETWRPYGPCDKHDPDADDAWDWDDEDNWRDEDEHEDERMACRHCNQIPCECDPSDAWSDDDEAV